MTKSIHPFPARMAPGLALESLAALKPGSVVLDPMTGSGTVIRQAVDLGHRALGVDVDPLAVLMSAVWTTPVPDELIEDMNARLGELVALTSDDVELPWMMDSETSSFVDYWFAPRQASALRRLAAGIFTLQNESRTGLEAAAIRVIQLALSRIIITKEQAASLARDTSHSRPHRVALTSDYDVFSGYEKALATIRQRLVEQPPASEASVILGDARSLRGIEDGSVDAVVTSPPYLNAIDYLRGHRLALIWLGWSIPNLRAIRAGSIGTERGPDKRGDDELHLDVVRAMIGSSEISSRHRLMIDRYATDLCVLLREIARVIIAGGRATFVVGNSCLKGTFIRNADGVAAAARAQGFRELARAERALPENSRYLPVTGVALAKRMRTETVLSFAA